MSIVSELSSTYACASAKLTCPSPFRSQPVTGKPVTGCDLNGDGHVSFAEAHAYVLLNSETIDIPTTTSEALLRSYSKTTGDDMSKPQMPFRTLLARSSPLQKVVLEGLCDQLRLTSEDRFDDCLL